MFVRFRKINRTIFEFRNTITSPYIEWQRNEWERRDWDINNT